MTWMVVLQICVLVAVTGAVIAMLMKSYNDMQKEIKLQMIGRISNEVVDRYLPQVVDAELQITEKVMDKICDKIPDMMENVMESTTKVMKKMEEEY